MTPSSNPLTPEIERCSMPYNEQLAQRIDQILRNRNIPFIAKKMMGGLCYMVDQKMCVGVDKDRLMARLGPEIYEASLGRKGCQPMDITGRPLKGFVFVLGYWIDRALDYNPKAKSSKKNK